MNDVNPINSSFSEFYLQETALIAKSIDIQSIEKIAAHLAEIRTYGGRVFFIGLGGSAANAAHAVNDFRKLAHIDAYAPTDNVAEFTARINDEGWIQVFEDWLKASHLKSSDAIFVLSVGGGDLKLNISPNIVKAIDFSRSTGAKVLGIVGREQGYTSQVGDEVVVVPEVNANHLTAHSEEFQSILLHLLVSHPLIKTCGTKW
jgi:D-sedoheptulose 7-phosphate isomerase